MGVPPTVFNPYEQDTPIPGLAGTGIEYRVRGIGPMLCCQDRVGWVALKEFALSRWSLRLDMHLKSSNFGVRQRYK